MLIKGYKVKLKPNNKQKTRMLEYAEAAHFAYNWVLEKEYENMQNNLGYINVNELRKAFTRFRNEPENEKLRQVSRDVQAQAMLDADLGFRRYFQNVSKEPRYKTEKSKKGFYQSSRKIQFTESHVRIEGLSSSLKRSRQVLNWVRLAEKSRIPIGAKYLNPRFSFDGKDWWVSVAVISDTEDELKSVASNLEGIGIDLGVKVLACCSDNSVYENINKQDKIKGLYKKKKELKRKKVRQERNSIDNNFISKNEIKVNARIKKINQKILNIRHDYLNKVTTGIVSKPVGFFVIEDLDVAEMIKRPYLGWALKQECFAEFRRQIEYKAKQVGKRVIIADRWYPSSKTCSCCGSIKKDLKLSDRVYECPVCHTTIDRDLNASINLRKYGLKKLL